MSRHAQVHPEAILSSTSVSEREELVYALLASLPRSHLAGIQRKIAPLLLLDVVGLLPNEVALQIFSYLRWQDILTCCLVSSRWYAVASDPILWKRLCDAQGWRWRRLPRPIHFSRPVVGEWELDSDDEGMGDEEDDSDSQIGLAGSSLLSRPHHYAHRRVSRKRHSAPSILGSHCAPLIPDYKLLHQTHVRLRNRFAHRAYELSTLQTRRGAGVGGEAAVHGHGHPNVLGNAVGNGNAHTSTIYCLQLYTYPETGVQVLFTGSRDRTIREWNLATRRVVRVIEGAHDGSVLTLCVGGGFIVGGGSDNRVSVWDLAKDVLVERFAHHEDSVLCVRFDSRRLVTCSKDRTIRTYSFPDLEPEHELLGHRAAVNAVALSGKHIISASGDRSIRLWDADSGDLVHVLENHHARGIASIAVALPFILSGSSDKHLRLFDLATCHGWSTSAELENALPLPLPVPPETGIVPVDEPPAWLASAISKCYACGAPSEAGPGNVGVGPAGTAAHADLIRSVALGADFVVSASYDLSIKVWERKTGTLLANLTGGHTGRIFCVDFDCTKIVSCGEDQKICIWDFAHGIDTRFVTL